MTERVRWNTARPEVIAIDTPLSIGAQHYVLLLAPRLLADMDRVGLPRIVRCSGFSEHEITALYFEFVSVCRVLPPRPDPIPEELWNYLAHCVQLVSTLIHTAEKSRLEEARQSAVKKYLPQARSTVLQEYEEQCQEGTIEFRLATLIRDTGSPEQSRELCREALRLERDERYLSCHALSTEGMRPSHAIIVDHALSYAHQAITRAPDHFASIDLVIRLLDLLQRVRKDGKDSPSDADEDAINRIVLGLGNVLFSEELDL